jgi:serine/threonine-protein kinase
MELGVAALERALALSGRAARFLGFLGYAYGRAERREDARRLLAELEARRAERYVPRYFPALVHAGLGEVEAALDTLEQGWEERDTMLRDLKVDPPWNVLHGEPRYAALLARIGLAG